MEIIFKEEKGNLFGSTKILGIGKRQPKLIYGEKAKELREDAKISVEDLAKEFEIRPNLLSKIESQQASLDEKTMNKYISKFNVTKEYFFDLDLETLILSGDGHALKSFDTSKECREYFDYIMTMYFDNVYTSNGGTIDFQKSLKELRGEE